MKRVKFTKEQIHEVLDSRTLSNHVFSLGTFSTSAYIAYLDTIGDHEFRKAYKEEFKRSFGFSFLIVLLFIKQLVVTFILFPYKVISFNKYRIDNFKILNTTDVPDTNDMAKARKFVMETIVKMDLDVLE